jgi:hypothetical protein
MTKAGSSRKLFIKFGLGKDFLLPQMQEITAGYRGDTPIILYIEETGQKLSSNPENYVNPTEELMTKLKQLLGDDCVVLK